MTWELSPAKRKKEIKAQITRRLADALSAGLESIYIDSLEVVWEPGDPSMQVKVSQGREFEAYFDIRVQERR